MLTNDDIAESELLLLAEDTGVGELTWLRLEIEVLKGVEPAKGGERGAWRFACSEAKLQ